MEGRSKMVITMGSYRLEHRQWVNKVQLKEYLVNRCKKYSLLGEDIDTPQEFFSVAIESVESRFDNIGIGIYSVGIGLQPEIYLQPETRKLFVGFNSNVCGMNLLGGTMTFCHELNSPFYSFAPVSVPPQILVQHEVGLMMLTEEGKVIWKFDGDIITGLQYYDNRIDLQFLDAPPISLTLDFGKRLE
jgi:hypothetical protein